MFWASCRSVLCCSKIAHSASHQGLPLLIFPNSCCSLLRLRGCVNIVCRHQRNESMWCVCTQCTEKGQVRRVTEGRTGKRASAHWGQATGGRGNRRSRGSQEPLENLGWMLDFSFPMRREKLFSHHLDPFSSSLK